MSGVIHKTTEKDIPTRITREDVARIVALVNEVDKAKGPHKTATAMRIVAESTMLMAAMQMPGVTIDEDALSAFITSDDRQSALLGYTALVLNLVQNQL